MVAPWTFYQPHALCPHCVKALNTVYKRDIVAYLRYYGLRVEPRGFLFDNGLVTGPIQPELTQAWKNLHVWYQGEDEVFQFA